jgi:hypothetical protein
MSDVANSTAFIGLNYQRSYQLFVSLDTVENLLGRVLRDSVLAAIGETAREPAQHAVKFREHFGLVAHKY